MKKQTLWISLILVAMFAAAAVSTSAQTAYGLRANVPFDFVVGDKTIPAGRIAAQGSSDATHGALAIRNLTQGDVASRAGRRLLGSQRANQGKLVFHKYGDRYFLAQICVPGFQTWEVMKSKEERSLEREMRVVKNFKASQVVAAATRQ